MRSYQPIELLLQIWKNKFSWTWWCRNLKWMAWIPDAEPVKSRRNWGWSFPFDHQPFDQFLKTLNVWKSLKRKKLCLVEVRWKVPTIFITNLQWAASAKKTEVSIFWQLTIFLIANSCFEQKRFGRNKIDNNCVTALAHLCLSGQVMKFGWTKSRNPKIFREQVHNWRI